MTKQFNKLMIIITILTSVSTYNAHGMMGRYLVTLAGDACLLASAGAKLTQEMTLDDAKTFLEFGKPSQLNQIRTDAQKILPYVPLLIPGGMVLSVGGRLGMIARAPIQGLLLTSVSIPANIGLIGSAYALRLERTPDNAGFIGKTTDTMHEIWKRLKE